MKNLTKNNEIQQHKDSCSPKLLCKSLVLETNKEKGKKLCYRKWKRTINCRLPTELQIILITKFEDANIKAAQ